MRRARVAVGGGVLLVSFLFAFNVQVSARGWRAGVARVDITPEDTLWLAGYAARTHAATGTLTRLWVKALALEDSLGHRAVLVTSDLVGYPKAVSDTIRDRCWRRYGLSREQILLTV